MATDWTDPCARATALREAYYALVSGGKEQQVIYQDAGQMRSVTYASSKVDLQRLLDEIKLADQECAGGTIDRTRFAMRGGALRRGAPPR